MKHIRSFNLKSQNVEKLLICNHDSKLCQEYKLLKI